MRITKLEQAVNSISSVTPRWRAKMCGWCGDMIKGEPIWFYQYWNKSVYRSVYSASQKIWVCRVCAPNKSNVIKLHPMFFGQLDTTLLEQEETKVVRPDFKGKKNADV